jgi:cathepsin B
MNNYILIALFACALAVDQAMVDEINSKQSLWRASLEHPISRMSHAEVKKLLGVDMSIAPVTLPAKTFSQKEILAAPESFDSRAQWPDCKSMKVIRDQSSCGSCWAFGAVEAMSDRECVYNKRDHSYSAEDMNSCANEFSIISCGSCNGGNPSCAFYYWQHTGVISDDCFPYSLPSCDHHVDGSSNPCPTEMYPTPACPAACKNSTVNIKTDRHKASSTYTVSGADKMATEISTNGPCEAAFTVYEDFLAYKGGIYKHVSGASAGGHAVKIIGYGVENGVKYWLIANSWNVHFGEQGFFRIIRGTNDCGIEDNIYCGIPAAP